MENTGIPSKAKVRENMDGFGNPDYQLINAATREFYKDHIDGVPLCKEAVKNREFSLYLIKEQPHLFSNLSNELKSNKEFVLEAITINPQCLKVVSPEFKDDKEIVLQAVKQDEALVKYASKDLQQLVETKGMSALEPELSTYMSKIVEMKDKFLNSVMSVENKNKLR